MSVPRSSGGMKSEGQNGLEVPLWAYLYSGRGLLCAFFLIANRVKGGKRLSAFWFCAVSNENL